MLEHLLYKPDLKLPKMLTESRAKLLTDCSFKEPGNVDKKVALIENNITSYVKNRHIILKINQMIKQFDNPFNMTVHKRAHEANVAH